MRIYSYLWLAILLFSASLISIPSNAGSHFHHSDKDLPGIRLPDHPQSILEDDSPGCNQFTAQFAPHQNPTNPDQKNPSPMQVKLLHHHHMEQNRHKTKTTLLLESLSRDRSRLNALHHRKNNSNPPKSSSFSSSLVANSSEKKNPQVNSNSTSAEFFKAEETLIADVESGVSVGSGEYFIDVFIGTPPRHFQLIVDTGSDLNWVQCLPCEDCYPQEGPLFNSTLSSSYRPVPCSAEECSLVDTGAAGQTCTNSTPSAPCKYFYWYGDRSNTTGELAFETFTVNVSGAAKTLPVDGVIFGCGHANRGLFHGPAGLLGLGRGQLSFASQLLRHHHGHKFSYCLMDRNSDLSVTSKLVFGEDHRLSAHPDFQTTAFLSDGGTFYFLNVSSATVGGERVDIPSAVWDVSAGGIIIDSGTTLTYLAQPAYGAVKAAFESKIPYARGDFSPLELCYNVSGVEKVKLPEFSFRFGDGAVWKFPAPNYFIQPDPEESVVCLAVLGTPAGSLSILGNYQQQNFHVMYDVEESRLGFAPMACADV